jgi:Family of unknown function (DUF6312)
MREIRMHRSVKRITILQKDVATGKMVAVKMYSQSGRKRKKRSRGLRLIEKVVRRLSRAQNTMSGVYSARHERSNRKKRDGWLKDLIPNVVKAQRKGYKRLKK